MKTIKLIRKETSENGTFGELVYPGKKLDSLERPWMDEDHNGVNDNTRGESCIPAGKYVCKWTFSNRFKKKTYELINVPGRSSIRIHSANMVDQLSGCISLGIRYGNAVQESRYSVNLFAVTLNYEDFELEIIDAFAR